ncbi:hypothetical protein GCM10018953_16030 [Streptosporangium nondiastaticum]
MTGWSDGRRCDSRTKHLDGWARRLAEAGHPVTFDDEFPGMRRFHSEDPHGNRLEFLEPIA